MHIGIEAERGNSPTKTGVEHYVKQLIIHIAKIDSTSQYTLYLRTQPEAWFSELPANFKTKVMPFPKFWTQIRLSWEMLWHAPDVFMIPASALPVIHPKHSVVTIHDTAWEMFPEGFTWFMRNYLHYSTWWAVKRAQAIMVNSTATKEDLIKYYKVDRRKVHLALFGYDAADYSAVPMSEGLKSKLPEKYVVYLATLQPRKNVPGLIRAFKLMKQQHPEIPHKLVIAGWKGWKYEPIMRAIEENKDIVTYVGRVSDDDRKQLLLNADVLALSSFYEGFGMQLLEAYQAGIPVVTSNVSCLPEVAGPGALYFDPYKDEEIKDALVRILTDEPLRQQLAARGKEHLKNFSWDKCAKETWEVLTKLRDEKNN
jgi:glycosyltransferase involved in cell wall biosynthesis